MKKLLAILALAAVALGVWLLFINERFAAAVDRQAASLGELEFPNSGAAEAQGAFINGLLWLHSFQYEDAAESFREAQGIDPDFAMAYWGEAQTHNHPVWFQQDRDAAVEVLNRLAPTAQERIAKTGTDRERRYMEAIEILYGGGDKQDRDDAYCEAMRRMTEDYPEDMEAWAFYAVSLIGTAHEGRDVPTYIKAAAAAGRVFAQNKKHPGAAHYLIHSFDDPTHAPLGLAAALAYSEIAPSASHALHMPTHIFFALGMWDDAIKLNRMSYEAAEERRVLKDLPLDSRNYHALVWEQHAYLQSGRPSAAQRLLEVMEANAAASGTKLAHGVLASMRAIQLVGTERWGEISVADNGSGDTGVNLYVSGVTAVKTGDLAGAKLLLASWMTDVENDSQSGSGYLESARTSAIMAVQLRSIIEEAQGNLDGAVELALAAAEMEDGIPFDFGPPVPVKPAHELVGEMLLAAGDAEAAQVHFAKALKRAPLRARSLLGLGRAAERGGNMAAAAVAFGDLREIWHSADLGLPELAEIDRFLAETGDGS